jgi:hypothetical protein
MPSNAMIYNVLPSIDNIVSRMRIPCHSEQLEIYNNCNIYMNMLILGMKPLLEQQSGQEIMNV